MRSKEEAHELSLFPDPDLLPLEFDQGLWSMRWRKALPELPDDKKARLIASLGLSAYDASVLVSDKAIADYFEKVAEGLRRQDGRQLGHQPICWAR